MFGVYDKDKNPSTYFNVIFANSLVETFTRNLRMTTSVYLRRCKNDTFEKVLKVDKISRDICSFGKKCEFSEIISTNVIKVKKPILLFVIFLLITATNHAKVIFWGEKNKDRKSCMSSCNKVC